MSIIFKLKDVRFDIRIHPDAQLRKLWLEDYGLKTSHYKFEGKMVDENIIEYCQSNQGINDSGKKVFVEHSPGIILVGDYSYLKPKHERVNKKKDNAITSTLDSIPSQCLESEQQ